MAFRMKVHISIFKCIKYISFVNKNHITTRNQKLIQIALNVSKWIMPEEFMILFLVSIPRPKWLTRKFHDIRRFKIEISHILTFIYSRNSIELSINIDRSTEYTILIWKPKSNKQKYNQISHCNNALTRWSILSLV